MPGRSRLRLILAWVLIAFSVMVIVVTDEEASQAGEANATTLGLRTTGRYAVGLHRINTKIAPALPSANDLTQKLTTQLDAAALSPSDKVRVLPVIAELRGHEIVIERLNMMTFAVEEKELAQDAALLRQLYANGASAISAGERTRLIRRLGWFGQLAVSWDQPDTNPARRDALAPAMRTVVGAFVAAVVVFLAGATGFVLLIVAIVRWQAGKMVGAGAAALAHRSDAGLLVEAFAIYLVSFVILQSMNRLFPGSLLQLLWLALYVLAPLACLWPISQGMRFRELRSRLGWHMGQGFFREAGSGVIGYLAGLPIMGAGILLTLLLSKIGNAQPSHPIQEWITWDFWRIVAALALASIYAPLAEETMFRGALYAGVRGGRSVLTSALVVAFVFAAIHPQGWSAIPVLMSLATTFAIMREWRGSLIAPMTAHALNNGFVVLLFALVAG